MNLTVQTLQNRRFSVLIITVLCVWPWCVKAIRNCALRTVHGALDIIIGPSSMPGRVRSKNPTRRVYRLHLHVSPCFTSGRRRFGHTPQVKARKHRKIRDGRRSRSNIMRRKRQVMRLCGWHFRNLVLIPPILFVLFSSVPKTNAQQAGSAQASHLSDKQAFQQIEDRWSQAIAKRDQYALELVLSPELIDISALGDQTTRDQQVAMLFEKNAEPMSHDQRVANVRTFGEVAVVIGSYDEQLRVKGKPVRQTGMFTHIYHNERGNWFCVNAQRTPHAESVPEKARGAAKHNHAGHSITGTHRSAQ
jgi:ketosteroid isomerase-like protein